MKPKYIRGCDLFQNVLNRDLKLIVFSIANRRAVVAGMAVLKSLYLYAIGFDPFTIGLLSTVATIIGAVRSAVVGILADSAR